MPFDPVLEPIATMLSPFPITWGFCGGWAIDLALNRITRPYKDVDVAILRRDQRVVFALLHERGWSLEQAVKGQLLPVLEGIFLQLPIHTIWCRHPTESPAFLEILLNEAEEDQFLFRPDSSIRFPLSEAFLRSPSGYPILAPKIALLYKARHPEHEQNWRDAQVMLPEMPLEHRQWFWDALQWLEPRHTWLKEWGTLRTRN